jgi:hypothetical protein
MGLLRFYVRGSRLAAEVSGVCQLDTGGCEFPLDGGDGAVEVDGAASIAKNHGAKSKTTSI